MTVKVVMFNSVGLNTNLDKTKSMVCTLGYIWWERSKEAYKYRETGEGATFRERKRMRVSCT